METVSASQFTRTDKRKRSTPEPEDLFTGMFPPPEDIIDDYQREKPLPFVWHVHKKSRRDSRDRTEWGYYRELAPPVLPIPAIFTTEFEEEIELELVSQRSLTSSQTSRTTDIGTRAMQPPSEIPALGPGVHRRKVSPLTRHSSRSPVSQPPQTLSDDSLNYSNMAPKVHWWISAWFIITAPVILWDVSYCFLRPRSMEGGDLHYFWKPYALYQNIDYIYGIKALEENDGFTNAQSLLNVFETVLNLVYVYLVHVLASPSAPVVGFAVATMTLWKTVLYWTQEYYCGWCNIGHNNVFDLILLWIVPNGLWIVIPTLIMWQLGNDISNTLRFASKLASGKAE